MKGKNIWKQLGTYWLNIRWILWKIRVRIWRIIFGAMNQSILKEISPGRSLEGLMLKLKPQYFCHLMQRADLLEKTLMLGKIEGWRRRGRQRMRWLDGITDSMDLSLGGLRELEMGQGGLVCCGSWGRRVGHDWATELNWIFYRVLYPLPVPLLMDIHVLALVNSAARNTGVHVSFTITAFFFF